jgi:glutamyl-tRNA synthetase
VGGARTALFNWLLARKLGGTLVLRIEDTDRERSSDDMTSAILDSLIWLGLDWDEGPYHQADGIDRHRAEVMRILGDGLAYRCFCTPDELRVKRDVMKKDYRYDRVCADLSGDEAGAREASGEPHTIRFRIPEGSTEWEDLVHGPTSFRNVDIEDFVLLRSDGTPTYNLAATSDDIDMAITHVIRGDDHIANTPKQILLYRALGGEVPLFGHLPMILGPDGKRLSKRHGATAVGEYREQGILPLALVNFLALLGWNPGDEQEVMSPPELISRFSVERINKKSAVFDTDKLKWMNGQHISLLPAAELLPLVRERLIATGLTSGQDIEDRLDWFHDLIDLVKPRARVLDKLVTQAYAYLAPTIDYEVEAVEKHWKDPEGAAAGLRAVQRALDGLNEWTADNVEGALRGAAEEMGIGFGKLIHPFRLALTGAAVSPGIHHVVMQMGPELVRDRIGAAIEALSKRSGASEG